MSFALRLVACPDPECGAVAEVTDSVALASTGGLVETARTYCVDRHTYVVPVERLQPLG